MSLQPVGSPAPRIGRVATVDRQDRGRAQWTPFAGTQQIHSADRRTRQQLLERPHHIPTSFFPERGENFRQCGNRWVPGQVGQEDY